MGYVFFKFFKILCVNKARSTHCFTAISLWACKLIDFYALCAFLPAERACGHIVGTPVRSSSGTVQYLVPRALYFAWTTWSFEISHSQDVVRATVVSRLLVIRRVAYLPGTFGRCSHYRVTGNCHWITVSGKCFFSFFHLAHSANELQECHRIRAHHWFAT